MSKKNMSKYNVEKKHETTSALVIKKYFLL